MPNTFTIAALFYDAHTYVAERLLTSIIENLQRVSFGPSRLLLDIRLGLNNVKEPTYRAIQFFTSTVSGMGYPVYWYIPCLAEGEPAMKYPMMRRAIYGQVPVESDYLVWFDDDSLMVSHQDWLGAMSATVEDKELAGLMYRAPTTQPQKRWVMSRPWAPQEMPASECVFPHGAFWVGKVEFLMRWNYPFPELRHNGGDTMLGRLVQAQCKPDDVVWLPYTNEFVKHNCDATLAPNSARGRGYHERSLGRDYVGHHLPTAHQYRDYEIIRHHEGKVTHARSTGKRRDAKRSLNFSDFAGRDTYQVIESYRQQRVPQDAQ